MKILLFLLLIISVSKVSAEAPVQPQDSTKGESSPMTSFSKQAVAPDSSEIVIPHDSVRTENVAKLFIIGRNSYKKQVPGNTPYPPFKGHWGGFYYGFVNVGHSDYSLYEGSVYEKYGQFMEVDWSRSFAMQFNVFRYSISLVPRNNFGVVCGLGFEYQRLRFESNYRSVTWEDGMVIPTDLHAVPEIANVKRSCFKNFYLTIPLLLELQVPARQKHKFYVSGGVMGGVRLHTKTKIVYKDAEGDKHKKKEKNNFNMLPFKADLVGRIGYRCINVWGSYTLTNMFKADKGPELHTYTIGLGVSF